MTEQVNEQMNKQLKKSTIAFMEEFAELMITGELETTDILAAYTNITEKVLVAAALKGGVKSNPEYSMKQKMVYMGNHCVAHAVQEIVESPMFKLFELIDGEK